MPLRPDAAPWAALPPGTVRVMLVDDHAIVREGYRRLLELEQDIAVVGEHGGADAALEALEQANGEGADVIVLDLSMPGRSGFEFLRRATGTWPRLRVLVFTMHHSAAMADQALRAGAAGFVTKNCEPHFLVLAVRRVAAGEPWVLSPDVQPAPQAAGERPTPLAPREFEVLQLLVQGFSVEEIGRRLELSSKTVANYQTLIRQKLGVATSIELLRYVQRHGLAAP